MSNRPQVFNNLIIQVPSSSEAKCTRLLRLPNGILTLLISDPSEDLASCSLCVASGSHLEPDDLPGLAHITEHMLFVSSKKYPKQEYYKQLVTNFGGIMNANTTGEQTTFFFSIPTDTSLVDTVLGNSKTQPEQLDRSSSEFEGSKFDHLVGVFASFFEDPLFNDRFLEKEIHAVENEHLQNMASLSKKLYHGLRLLSDVRHPFGRFCTGNFHTLYTLPRANKTSLRARMIDYFTENYLPENMTLVLRGPDSLNMLQKLAVSKFSSVSIKRRSQSKMRVPSQDVETHLKCNIAYDTWSTKYSVDAFGRDQRNRAILIDDNTKNPILRLYFPIKKTIEEQLDPLDFTLFKDIWCQIMGDESEGSLISSLFMLGYISGCSSSVTEVATNSSSLNIQLTLTPAGAKSMDQILSIFQDYTARVFTDEKTRKILHIAKYMSQYNTIEILRFMNKDANSSSVDELCDLSQLLQCDFRALPPKWLVKGSPLFDFDSLGYCGGYNESSKAKKWWISKALQYVGFIDQVVRSDNILLAFIGPQRSLIPSKCMPDLPLAEKQRDPFFLFNYRIVTLQYVHIDHQSLLSLPRPNQFLSGLADVQTRLIERLAEISYNASKSGLGMTFKNIGSYSFPKLASYDEGHQFFVKKELGKLYRNKVFFTMDLIGTCIEPSVTCSLAIEILCAAVRDRLREVLYPALLLGYSWLIIPSLQGDARITINIAGHRDLIFNILELIITEFRGAAENIKDSISNAAFRNLRVKLRSKYEGLADENSLFVALLGLYVSLEENTWQIDERFESLETMTFDTFQRHVSSFFNQKVYFTCFLHGDIGEEAFKTTILPVVSKLAEPGVATEYTKPSTICLPEGCNYCIKKTSAANDPTNSISVFIQTGYRTDIYSRTVTKLLVYIMSVSLLHKLRSEAQLGYAVLVGMRIMRNTIGIHISIMSGDYSPEYLEREIEKMLYIWWKSVFSNGVLTNDQFEDQYVNRFIKFCRNPNQTLEAVGGPSSLFANAITSESGDSKLLKEHEAYWFQISSEMYQFSKDSSGEDAIDISVLNDIGLVEFNKFVEERILYTSKTRAKISVMIMAGSKYAKQEIMAMKLEGFLRMNSLNISRDKIKEIIAISKGSNATMLKEFVRYFQSQGKLLRFMSMMTKEVLSALTGSMRAATSGSNSTLHSMKHEIEDSIEVEDLTEFQEKLGFHRSCITLDEKLKKIEI